ncbi:MAG: hypothetical protein DHS20C04_27020 [Hyphococcus sp.]|nr:MAG: hypothetical protein DHS20C04_27020 [Marinicaulis sp.]
MVKLFMIRFYFFMFFVTLTGSCESVGGLNESTAGCLYNDDIREWTRLPNPPANAERLTAIIDKNAYDGNIYTFNSEEWFALPTGEVMLCRRYIPYKVVLSSEWWSFDSSIENPKLLSHDGIIVVN